MPNQRSENLEYLAYVAWQMLQRAGMEDYRMTGKPINIKLIITCVAFGTGLGALQLQVEHNSTEISKCMEGMEAVKDDVDEIQQITAGMAVNIQGMADRFDDMYDMVLELWRGE